MRKKIMGIALVFVLAGLGKAKAQVESPVTIATETFVIDSFVVTISFEILPLTKQEKRALKKEKRAIEKKIRRNIRQIRRNEKKIRRNIRQIRRNEKQIDRKQKNE